MFSPAFRGPVLYGVLERGLAEKARPLDNFFVSFVLIGSRPLPLLVYQYYHETGLGPLSKPLLLSITEIGGTVGIETAVQYGMSCLSLSLFIKNFLCPVAVINNRWSSNSTTSRRRN